jgi:hypothetical protein
MLLNHEHMLNSQVFDLNNIFKLQHIKTNSFINIKLKSDTSSLNKLFANLYDYARDPLFIKIMNIVEIEHMKHYNKYISNYGMNKTQKQNKNKTKHTNFKLTRHKLTRHKNKTNDKMNDTPLYMLSNLKMMIYDYDL